MPTRLPTMKFKPPQAGTGCSTIVPHRAFRRARAAILEAAGRGGATLAVLGEAGTGKTWLLRHLASKLRERGHRVTLLRQGDLPYQLVAGTVLLIDEASRLDPQALAALAAQDQALVVLADLPNLGQALPLAVRTVRLPPLDPAEVPGYVAAWLQLSGHSADAVSPDGIARLALHSGGTPRLLTRLLDAAFALGEEAGRVTGAEIDEVALLRLHGLAPEPVEPPPEQPGREAIRRGFGRRLSAAIAALRWRRPSAPLVPSPSGRGLG